MTSAPRSPGLTRLSGTIRNYRCTRAEADFVFNDADRNTMGVVAIAAALTGQSGAAIATASAAGDTEEFADYVEFDLNGEPVKGWMWRSPFKEGDEVMVAAEWRGDHFEAGAIARPSDRVIALYPHCSRGIARHVRNAIKWWAIIVLGFYTCVALFYLSVLGWNEFIPYLQGDFQSTGVVALWSSVAIFFALMVSSLARRWMPYVRLTEKVCRTLGLPNPSNIDLPRSSKAQRKPDDPGEYGTFYFRY